MERLLNWRWQCVAITVGFAMASVPAFANCSVDTRSAGSKTFRIASCDESDSTIEEAKIRQSRSCDELEPEFVNDCYEAVAASLDLRRESMLRRALNEVATVEEAALQLGYSIGEVEDWIAANESVALEPTLSADAEYDRLEAAAEAAMAVSQMEYED